MKKYLLGLVCMVAMLGMTTSVSAQKAPAKKAPTCQKDKKCPKKGPKGKCCDMKDCKQVKCNAKKDCKKANCCKKDAKACNNKSNKTTKK